MANVRFLRGATEDALNKQKKVDGSIYIVQDTGTMYVDFDTERVRVGGNVQINEDIEVTDSTKMNALLAEAQVGVFYYIAKSNALIIKKVDSTTTSGYKWDQINSPTEIGTFTTSVSAAAGDANSVTVKSQVAAAGGTKTASYDIKPGSNVKINAADDGGSVTIGATDTYVNTKLSLTNNIINVENWTDGVDSNGDSLAAKTGSSGGSIAVTAQGAVASLTSNSSAIALDINAVHNSQLNFKDGTLYADIALRNNDNTSTIISTESGQVKFGVRYGQDQTNKTKSYPISYDTDDDSYLMDLNVYTVSEVDDKIAREFKTANAMTFKGTVSDQVKLPASQVSLGDTYVVSANADIYDSSNSLVQGSCRVGDMFIAGPTGTEDDVTGYLKTIVWQYIPSGDDKQYTAAATLSGSQIQFNQYLGGSFDSAIGTIKAGEKLGAATSGTTFTINHAQIAAPTSLTGTGDKEMSTGKSAYSADFVAVTGVKTDSYGHITELTSNKIGLRNSVNSAFNIVGTEATESSSAELSFGIKDSYESSVSDSLTLKSSDDSNIKFTVDNSNTKAVNIDLVWGSF